MENHAPQRRLQSRFLFPYLLRRKIPQRRSTGKIIAARIPALRLPPAALETSPARVGPPPHPRSPARASRANIAVPPPRIVADALLNVPGHIIPTENPHTAQPIRFIAGTGTNIMHIYDATQSRQLKIIKLSRRSLSPNLP